MSELPRAYPPRVREAARRRVVDFAAELNAAQHNRIPASRDCRLLLS